MLLSDRSYLLSSITYRLAHDKAVCSVKALAFLKLLINRIKLVDNANVLKLLGFLVVSLTSKDQDTVMIPRKMHGYDVRTEWELLVSFEVDSIPTIAFHRITFDSVEAFTIVLRHRHLHELVIHSSEDKDKLVVPSAASEIVSALIHLSHRNPFRFLVEIKSIVASLN